ncbi:hypothetical protein MNEG_16655 [Monoraphidium neglectum]|uniref:Uncharacterized protein n=1 Tax=Monoraphidium neglectum TaxID=145388 RepID=A0A0D2LGY9_9CHLO|nr:hypothetical protein MNEG_16655 [Monoraphidium neglectum]KIY91309.1 hypothetical protein MNEG_16655 [Monoraphidium neglectum]|eukprot:XP_013890329.1 hypothetical protein MNEG_16655 [Monoraphidium neglectum]
MRAALQRAVHELLDDAVAQGPPPPSQLAARVRCLQAAVAQLAPALGFDLSPDLFESLLLHCQPEPGSDAHPLDGPGSAGGSAEGPQGPALRMVEAYGAWLQDVLVRDSRGVGVMYAPAARAFTCVSRGARAEVAAYASLGELTELFRVARWFALNFSVSIGRWH